MKYWIIAVIVALILFVVLTRSVSSLKLKENQILLLKVDRHTVRMNTPAVKKKELDFRTVTVVQNLLKEKEGAFLVFEHAYTDQQYQFDHRSMGNIMKTLFAAKKSVSVYQKNNLAFYQIYLDDRDVINVIFHQSSDQALDFAYGFTNVKFLQILKEIEPSDRSSDKKLKDTAALSGHFEGSVKTKWSVLMNAIDSLIIPLDSSS